MGLDCEGNDPAKCLYMQLATVKSFIVILLTEEAKGALVTFFTKHKKNLTLVLCDADQEKRSFEKVDLKQVFDEVTLVDIQKTFAPVMNVSKPSLVMMLGLARGCDRPQKWPHHPHPYEPFNHNDHDEPLPRQHVVYAALDAVLTLGLYKWFHRTYANTSSTTPIECRI